MIIKQEDYIKAIEEQRRMIEAKESALFNFMTKEARERYRRVEMAHPEIANKALTIILQGVQTGRIKQANDETLRKILKELNNVKKDYNILRR